MSAELLLEQDLALKDLARTPDTEKPQFDWASVLNGREVSLPDVTVLREGEKEPFELHRVAASIGTALANLNLSRGEEDIFTDENREFVARVTAAVADNLVQLVGEGQPLQISHHDLHVLIEKTLVENNAFDVAKSLILNRSSVPTDTDETETAHVRLIRRNGQVVPWNDSKIEIAVRKSFLSLQKDSSPAVEIARAVTGRVIASKQAFVHIEEVQDMVQEELMKAGHYKTAEAYILYRARRTMLRNQQQADTVEAEPQQEMIVVTRPDGSTYFWEGKDLTLRIRFATIGLDLSLSDEEIEAELRRSVFNEITEADLQNTIILNAKTLIEKDADFAKFAARILLTYIYE